MYNIINTILIFSTFDNNLNYFELLLKLLQYFFNAYKLNYLCYFLNCLVIIYNNLNYLLYLANEAVIEFSDEGTERTLRIGAGVSTTFDCSKVVTALTTIPGVFITPSSIRTEWTFVEFDVNFAPQSSLTLSNDAT